MRLMRLALAAAAVSWGSVPVEAARFLAPHRAVYDLTLENASDRSGITGLSGRMVYEFNGSACEGYTVNFRFVTQIVTRDVSRLTDQQTTTYEDPEGKNFSFVTKSFVDQKLDKEVKGTAKLSEEKLDVTIDKPISEKVELNRTQFPTGHLLELLDKADQGESFYETTLFDGSDEADKVMTTTVIIGKQAPVRENDPELPALDKLKADPVRSVDIAYFDTSDSDGEEVPTYRISFKLHENGVTRDLVMDYGDFAMKGQLVKLELLPAAGQSCGK